MCGGGSVRRSNGVGWRCSSHLRAGGRSWRRVRGVRHTRRCSSGRRRRRRRHSSVLTNTNTNTHTNTNRWSSGRREGILA